MIPARLRLAYGIDGGVVFLTHWESRHTFWSLAGAGEDVSVGVIDYRRLKLIPSFRASAVVVCDVERMSVEDETRIGEAARLWRAQPDAPLILNAPPRPMRRYALLKTLRARGLQHADIHRLDDPATVDGISFPCFIRDENGHNIGRPTPVLLKDRDALAAAIAKLQEAGEPLYGKVAIEFEDLRDADGLYAKLSYFRVGDALIPSHKFYSRQWFVKAFDNALLDGRPDLAEREHEFIENAPHRADVKNVFDLAGVEYGRIDFATRADGALHVFEINTNPNHPGETSIAGPRLASYRKTRGRLRAALAALDGGRSPAALSWPREAYWARWRQRMRKVLRI